MALDASGNLYIADDDNNRIRKVDTNGIITTVAGNGSASYSGDGGAATNASLYYPCGVAFDASGNLYIADYGNNRIRKVDTNGIITTVAGNGSCGYSGDGGAATNASLYYPYGVALDAFGNLYIADYDNNRIRKVDTNGIITTVAGNGITAIPGTAARPPTPAFIIPPAWPSMPPATCILLTTDNNRIRKVLLYAGYPTFTLNNVGSDQCRQLHGGRHQSLRQRDQRRCDPDRGSAARHHQSSQPAR